MNFGGHIAYGILGAPLAMSALPVYIHTPKLYGEELGLGLALTGAILLLSRIVDTLQDPWLGRLADYLQRRPGGWPLMMLVAAGVLCISYAALFNPPDQGGLGLGVWFGATLVVVYTAHSALNITYLAWGARASEVSHERTQLVAFREGFSLVGVILASLLPMLFLGWLGLHGTWLLFSGLFALLLFVTLFLFLRHAPPPRVKLSPTLGIFYPLRHLPFRRLTFLLLLNGLAISIAATLALFYISDVLDLEKYSGALLALYFVTGAFSLPLWLAVARRWGKTISWIAGMLMAVIGFVWAVQLGTGDLLPYATVCVLSGLALGADLALPAAIAADIIPATDRGRTASYFGFWSLINKSVLAISAGVALPLLAGLGYIPGDDTGLQALAFLYAGVPCVLKLTTAALLIRWRSSLEVSYVA